MKEQLDDYLAYVRQPERDWSLFRISLEVCRVINRDMDFTPYFLFVDHLAQEVEADLRGDRDTYSIINAINTILFEHFAFEGNVSDYYNPLNSYMTFVLERRKGIPITLSLLYREISHRMGLRMDCVAMPGHFLLKHRMPNRDIFVDAFNRGQIILEDECLELLSDMYEGEAAHRGDFLASSPPRAVLLRMLGNLKQIYREQGNSPLLLAILERRIPLLDNPLPELLERGLTRMDTEDYRGALQDLEFFLEKSSSSKTKALIEKQIERIRRLATGN
jgi:regulator of sirC expression with transglutaminase-like and TPR domain